jgi:hypothetical protein
VVGGRGEGAADGVEDRGWAGGQRAAANPGEFGIESGEHAGGEVVVAAADAVVRRSLDGPGHRPVEGRVACFDESAAALCELRRRDSLTAPTVWTRPCALHDAD